MTYLRYTFAIDAGGSDRAIMNGEAPNAIITQLTILDD